MARRWFGRDRPARTFFGGIRIRLFGMILLVALPLMGAVGVSLYRIALGFLLGTVVGVPVGLAMGLFRPVLIFLEPYVQFFRFVPPVAWIIPAILWFGIGETPKVALVALGVALALVRAPKEDDGRFIGDVFEIDWARANPVRPRRFVRREAVVREAVGPVPPAGYKRVPLSELLKDD